MEATASPPGGGGQINFPSESYSFHATTNSLFYFAFCLACNERPGKLDYASDARVQLVQSATVVASFSPYTHVSPAETENYKTGNSTRTSHSNIFSTSLCVMSNSTNHSLIVPRRFQRTVVSIVILQINCCHFSNFCWAISFPRYFSQRLAIAVFQIPLLHVGFGFLHCKKNPPSLDSRSLLLANNPKTSSFSFSLRAEFAQCLTLLTPGNQSGGGGGRGRNEK